MLQTHLNMIKFLLLLGLTQIYAVDNDVTISVYTVTAKSMTVRWTKYEGAISYKVTATPKNSPEDRQVFAQFGRTTVMGSVTHLVPNTVYTMQVEAMDNALNVLSSAQTEHTTAPEIPTIEQVYSKQSDSITVEFTEVSGATGYILRAENDALGFFSETAVSGSPSTVLQLRPYTDYTLSVMAVNAGGRSQPSYTVDARTVVVAPRVVTSSPSNTSSPSIVVSWSPVEHAVQYTLSIIQQGTDNRTVLNTTEQTVLVEELEAGETYCIKTTAWDAEGRTGDDITECQITRPPQPDSPEVFYGPGPGRGQEIMSLYWDTSNGADRYVALSNIGQNCTTTETFCIISPLECGQVHSISLTAENDAGASNPSEPRGVVTFPCAPEDLWVQENEPGSCRVAWSNVSLADFYMAFIKRDDGAEYNCNTTSESCQFPCICGYTFLTTIFAYNEAGSSPQGKVLNYTTVPCCPEDVVVMLASTETLEITWQPVRGAELYETTAAQTDDVIHCNDTAPVCALSDLQCNTLYSVVVTPCSELRGCNLTCTPHTQETAPCAPEIINVTQTNPFSLQTELTAVRVLFTNPNSAPTNYTVTATGRTDSHSCHVSQSTSCELTELPCGTKYEVMAVAITRVGHSLPSFTLPLETGPCCPSGVNVEQITQAMTNVTWSPSNGARSYITSLTSRRGHAKCHTLETHCMMGCITCGTNYSVSLEAISSTGHKSQCDYQGFSSSACCPTGIKLYKMDNTSLRIYWRSSGRMQTQNYMVDLSGTGANYTCNGNSFCDLGEVMCGDVYTVVVAPVGQNGNTVSFCPRRMYSVSCSGGNIGMVIYRGKRSVD